MTRAPSPSDPTSQTPASCPRLSSHRAQLVVEDIAVALREAGDLIIPIGEGAITADALVPMRDIITESVAVDRSRPRVFKSSGMSWEDLVIAAEVFRAG